MPDEKKPAQYAWQVAATRVPSTFQTVVRLIGAKALGNIMSSRKGVFGLIAIAVSYIALIGALPADAPAEVVSQMTNTFVWIVGAIAALYMGGTAIEDAAEKKANGKKPPAGSTEVQSGTINIDA